jgi:hypothetical protein
VRIERMLCFITLVDAYILGGGELLT